MCGMGQAPRDGGARCFSPEFAKKKKASKAGIQIFKYPQHFFFPIKPLGLDVRHHRPFVLMSGADVRLPISRAKSLPSLGDPKRGPSFSQAPRFGRPASAARASSQAREPASPLGRPSQGKTGRGYKDQQRPAAPAAPAAPAVEFKEWKAVPVTELLPSEVSKAIRRIASQTGGGVVIEMQWGSSAYLPAHNGGQKYRDCAQRLQELISGRLSRGSPLPVHIVDKPIRFSKRSSHSLIREQLFRALPFFDSCYSWPSNDQLVS